MIQAMPIYNNGSACHIFPPQKNPFKSSLIIVSLLTGVAEPHHLDEDPDPPFLFDVDQTFT
jgi:hypothetical protein